MKLKRIFDIFHPIFESEIRDYCGKNQKYATGTISYSPRMSILSVIRSSYPLNKFRMKKIKIEKLSSQKTNTVSSTR